MHESPGTYPKISFALGATRLYYAKLSTAITHPPKFLPIQPGQVCLAHDPCFRAFHGVCRSAFLSELHSREQESAFPIRCLCSEVPLQ